MKQRLSNQLEGPRLASLVTRAIFVALTALMGFACDNESMERPQPGRATDDSNSSDNRREVDDSLFESDGQKRQSNSNGIQSDRYSQYSSGSQTGQGTGQGQGYGNGFGDGNGYGTGAEQTAELGDVFELFCTKAAETQVIARLQASYDRLCPGGAPSTFFRQTLPQAAYSGAGAPQLQYISAPSSSGNTTSMEFGAALDIPITMKDHFDRIGPKTGDPAYQKQLLERQEDYSANVTIDAQYGATKGTYHVRGWEVRENSSIDVFLSSLPIQTVTVYDQWNLVEGKVYMYSGYLKSPGVGLYTNDLLVAGLQVDNKTYLINISSIAADNNGFGGVAEGRMVNSAQAILTGNFQAAQ